MHTRIKELRKILKLTQPEFAQKLNLSGNFIFLIEKGERKPSDRTIADICRIFNVNENWLRTGEGEKFIPTPTFALDALVEEWNLTHGERILIEKFLNLKPEIRQALVGYVKEAASSLAHDAAPARPSVDIAAAEAAYEESLGIAPNTALSVSNTTDGAEKMA